MKYYRKQLNQLSISSGVTKGYRGEDKALEMDRKEGEACGVHRKGEAWKTDIKQNKKKLIKKNQTNKQTKKASNLLLA